MSELRYNIISREWVVIATERAKRPMDFAKKAKEKIALPEYRSDCPFCPGNEAMSPEETLRLANGASWKVRSAYNKFPALSPEAKCERSSDGVFSTITGFGMHEVIIEHPKHNMIMPLMADEEVADIIRAYKSRYLALEKAEHIEAITIFKNHGPRAGTSLEHPHSQLIATPIIPPHLKLRLIQAMNYYGEKGKCVYCQVLEEELREKKRIVLETDNFVSFMPYASLSPFHTWIFPRRHNASFAGISEAEIRDLAKILKNTWARIYYGLDNPDLNLAIYSTPTRERDLDFFHWYLSVIPRISETAGFELGSGMFINVALPEESAEFLRGVKV